MTILNIYLDNCSSTMFTCALTRKCLKLEDRCDGLYDCGHDDISDEQDCGSFVIKYFPKTLSAFLLKK